MGGEQETVDCVVTAGFLPRLLVQQKPTLYLQVSAPRDFLDCDMFNASHSSFRRL